MNKISFLSAVRVLPFFLFNGESQGINAVNEGNLVNRNLTVGHKICIDYLDFKLLLPMFK